MALIIRIGFWGPLYYNYKKGTPKIVLVIIQSPILPRGSIYTTIMELGPQNHNRDGLSVPNSIMVVYMDPLG